MNAKLILVGTEKENKKAVRLYKKVGFELGKKAYGFIGIQNRDC